MKKLIQKLLMEHKGYFGNVITHDLPTELDNSLYTLIHFLGKMDFDDVTNFAKKATSEQIEYLSELVSKFPSQQHELIVNAGGFKELRNSELYTEILEFIKGIDNKDLMREYEIKTFKQVLFESGGINQELRIEDLHSDFHGVTPEMKRALFKYWDKVGHAEWQSLKLVGMQQDGDGSFDNTLDLIYPILRIEWEGGIKGTLAYDDSQQWGKMFSDHQGSDHIDDLEYRIIPVGYDFQFDESVSYGDAGYSCWNIMVEFSPSQPRSVILWDGFVIGEELFEKKEYRLQSYRNYDGNEIDVLEDIWEREQDGPLGEYFRQFCQVGVKVLDYRN